MQLGRIAIQSEDRFAIRTEDSDEWTVLSDLGIDVATTSEAIARWDEITDAFDSSGPRRQSGETLRCPIVRPGKILAIGLNYIDHIRETNATAPEQPVVFAKYPSSLNDPMGHIMVDGFLTREPDYEAELAVIIGVRARRLTHDNALNHVFGYAVANDVSARDLQRQDSQFSRSKSFDTFCPVGPWITTADAIADPQDLRISSWVNNEVRQDSSTSQMLFPVADLLVYLSSTMTLEPGDVVLTGTPPGVGLGRKPPLFLTDGDVVRCEIAGLGAIENQVHEDPNSRPAIPVERREM